MRQSLAGLRLQPKEEKTRIAPIDTGFAFLGLSFGPDLDEGYVSAANLEKTLFIRSQFVFVGLDYDSIIIRKDKQLLRRCPAWVSTLQSQCGKENVLKSKSMATQHRRRWLKLKKQQKLFFQTQLSKHML